MKTKHLCIYLDDQHMPLVTVISVPIPITAQSLRDKVARWAWKQLHTSPPERGSELFDPEGEHLSIVGLDDGRLDEIKWFEVDKTFGQKKLNGRFNTHGESDEEREAYNQAHFETCKEFVIARIEATNGLTRRDTSGS